ncbi:hypothetical protein EV586_110121 [Tumebacillus sp. BK434]|uniref:hypothetical protein n=1 Tax=Tumebacillus sp. BK434 TaxID=2512169 RepID=UPI0010498E15|nr:hypothetical protein [Tumebacillus sp. BK434]TCP52510.1 hypothetical protein EV586_110121 [Tumebacillus sp. BK434]
MCRYHVGNCRPYVGKMVHVQTKDGQHRGVVERVNSRGLYLRPVGMASGEKENLFRTLEAPASDINAEHIFYGGYRRGFGYGRGLGYGPGLGYGRGLGYGYGYNPAAFFVPFLTILALTGLLFW